MSLTGYSGGGKKMIAQYEADGRCSGDQLSAPRQYGLTQIHKHIPEIKKASGLKKTPAFLPVVADYYSGMEVTIPIGAAGNPGKIREIFSKYYKNQPLVTVKDYDDNGFIGANRLTGSNKLEITVKGNEENVILVATYDNLGKGASGAAVQNMNIMLGIDEVKGLI
jgi:N-acetyl-gamma-glutamyl-phosphate reductase